MLYQLSHVPVLCRRTKAPASRDCEEKRGKVTGCVLLLQDNAPACTSEIAMAAVTKCSFEVLHHPPYSPDLAPSDLSVSKFEKLTFVVGILEAMKAS